MSSDTSSFLDDEPLCGQTSHLWIACLTDVGRRAMI